MSIVATVIITLAWLGTIALWASEYRSAPMPMVRGAGLDVARNRAAVRLANAALRIATPEYRGFVKGSIRYGLAAAAQDAQDEDDR